jgi:mycofactocin precursor
MTSIREHGNLPGEVAEPQAVESAPPATRSDATGRHASESQHVEGLIAEDLLVEDVSIDGMCGVY